MSQTDQPCCGVVEEVRLRHKEAIKPQPWIVRKLAVVLTILIVGYSTYVYVARFCKDMMVKSTSALANQATGVAFLVVFCLLLFLTSWCYVIVITTSPGNARQYTQTATRPDHDHHDRSPALNSPQDFHGTSYELIPPTPNASRPPTHESARKHSHPRSSLGSGMSRTITSQRSAVPSSAAKSSHSHGLEEARGADAFGTPEYPFVTDTATLHTHANTHPSSQSVSQPNFSRRPTTTPVLLPEYRYCGKCQIVKPSRAHHCRACGTCILKYDHHCPWIGQCVGAFNQKFFVNFLLWATVFWLWTFSTLLGLNVKPRAAPVPDPQQIVVIALSGLFGIFCGLVLASQLHLILLNQTTVESLSFKSMRDREQELLSKMYKWYHVRHLTGFVSARQQTRKEWDSEWGRIGIEGNLWWLGNRAANWAAVMGKNVWWWILPVGRHLDDGLHYPTNPRFDAAGRWKRRKEWPPDLR